MPAPDRKVEDVAAAILDGTLVDWSLAESGATAHTRELLEELRVLSTLANVHRSSDWTDVPGSKTASAAGPAQWGRLRLVERIGGGAFGQVYRAWDPRLHREVALKLISAAHYSNRADEIIREGRLLARVRHPGVVTIYDAEQIGAQVGLCMEFVEGPTVEQRVQQHGPLPSDEAVATGVQLCDAVAAVHAAGVLHRDIKAANAVIKADGTVVLMDFGAGRSVDGEHLTGATGTPLYLAPEVLDGEPATVGSDIYSLGVLLHYVLTGSHPVTAMSLPELRLAHRRRSEAWESGEHPLDSRIAPRVRPVLERALDPRPERRHDTVTALAEELRRVQRGRGAPRSRLTYAAAVIAAAFAAGAFLIGRGESSQPARLAILPLAFSGGGAETNVLREGVTRDLIAQLERYDGVRVIATASVFADEVLRLTVRDIGQRLGVAYVVTGQMTRSGGQLDAEVSLVRTSNEQARWSKKYNRPASELLDLNRAIAADLIQELDVRDHVQSRETPPRNPEAYHFYVQGQAALDTFTPQGQRAARQLFEQALSIDPNYAQAHAAMARVYLSLNPQIAGLPAQEALQRASDAAGRAMKIDPSLPDAYVAAAVVKSARSDWNGAEADYTHAIEIAPSNVLALQEYAHWLSLHARFDDALEHAQAAESLDPLSPRAILARSSVLRLARRYDEALAQTLKALDIDPLYPAAHANAGHCYEGLGRMDEAIEAFQRAGRSSGNLAHAYGRAGRIREARALIALLEEKYGRDGVGAGEVAQAYIGLGELGRAFDWLERADHRWPTTLKVAAVWDPLRSHPRFKRLLEQRGLDR